MDSPQLTPRSKIKAMMLAVEGESSTQHDQDSPDQGSDAYQRVRQQLMKTSSNRTPHDQNNSDQESDAYQRVRQQLMKTSSHRPQHDPNISDQESDAYQRVRQRLMRSFSSQSQHDRDSSDQDSDAYKPVRQRLMKSSSSQPSTPEPAQTPQTSPPGLFLTPASLHNVIPDNNSPPNHRFLALVARKKAEREAREAAQNPTEPESSSEEIEPAIARPRRKAGKRALEEMARETQRLSRNQQLAHAAQTRKKITKESLLARFNWPTPSDTVNPVAIEPCASAAEAPAAEAPAAEAVEPPTEIQRSEMHMDDLPDMDEILAPEPPRKPLPTIAPRIPSDSDSDLEIEPPNKMLTAIFNRPSRTVVQERRALRNLRFLAQLNTLPERTQREVPSVSSLTLQSTLLAQARRQATEERNAKMEELKAKGIVVQTSEEKAREQVEVEDLLEKARTEAAALKKKERHLTDDSSGDEDWGQVDFSGSDDESDGSENQDVPKSPQSLIEAEQEQQEEEQEEKEQEKEQQEEVEEEQEEELQSLRRARKFIDDDEDMGVPVPSIFRDQGTKPLSMTQLFQGTVGQSQISTQASLPFMEPPEPYVLYTEDSRDSPPAENVSIVPETEINVLSTQASAPDPTPDAGFQAPALIRHTPPSTVETVILPSLDDPPRRNRLRRKSPAKKKKKASRASTNEAKVMVEEQAEESEDEYAGLGGVSDEESDEEDEQVAAMMDDAAVDLDERRLAAMHANRERDEDEKAVNKLFKDITNGGLRRKRTGAGDFDLSDSDDDAEIRRRRKQREFAKMRKALLENEHVGKIADDPKKLAFLQAIEDHDPSVDSLDFLAHPAQDSFAAESSEERAPAAQRRTVTHTKPANLEDIRDSVSFLIEHPAALEPDLEYLPESSGPIDPDIPSSSPAQSTALDIVDVPLDTAAQDLPGLDTLLAAPVDEVIHKPIIEKIDPTTETAGSMPDGDTVANSTKRHPRRTAKVVDRLFLKRQSSSSLSNSSTSSLAFCAVASRSQSSVPSLLRRATTSNLLPEGLHAATERSAGGKEQAEYVKRGGRKGSSISAFQRVDSQKTLLSDRSEQRRRAEMERLAERRPLVSLSRVLTWDA